MGNVQMEADQIRYKDSSGTYRNVQTGLAAAIAGGGGGSSTLAGLTDTDITTPTNGQVLAYDSTESKWVNAASASGATTLEGLTDTAISTPSDGQVLTYDGTAEKWENAAIPAQSIDGLSDTTITTPSDGQVLTYDGTAEKWENSAIPAQSIDGLSDTTITTPSDGQVLTYDGTAEKWVNASGGSGGGGEVYPATETKIGKWGTEDLYRVCISETISGQTPNLMTDIPSTYVIRNFTGVVRKTTDSSVYPTPYYKSTSDRFVANLTVSSNKYLVVLDLPSSGASYDVNYTIDYTKPTTP